MAWLMYRIVSFRRSSICSRRNRSLKRGDLFYLSSTFDELSFRLLSRVEHRSLAVSKFPRRRLLVLLDVRNGKKIINCVSHSFLCLSNTSFSVFRSEVSRARSIWYIIACSTLFSRSELSFMIDRDHAVKFIMKTSRRSLSKVNLKMRLIQWHRQVTAGYLESWKESTIGFLALLHRVVQCRIVECLEFFVSFQFRSSTVHAAIIPSPSVVMLSTASEYLPFNRSLRTDEAHCPAVFDNLCWPQTVANESITVSCSPLSMQGVDATSKSLGSVLIEMVRRESCRISHPTLSVIGKVGQCLVPALRVSWCVGSDGDVLHLSDSRKSKGNLQIRLPRCYCKSLISSRPTQKLFKLYALSN